jgi:hypothetical protein
VLQLCYTKIFDVIRPLYIYIFIHSQSSGNCHASAEKDLTFSSLANIKGEAGTPLVFLS